MHIPSLEKIWWVSALGTASSLGYVTISLILGLVYSERRRLAGCRAVLKAGSVLKTIALGLLAQPAHERLKTTQHLSICY